MGKSLVLGFFDGVHRAHKIVIDSALKYSDDVALITLSESPAIYFGKTHEYILSRKDSIEKIKSLGVNSVIELDFTKYVSMTAKDYLEFLIKEYHPISISTGYNHTFGYNKFGNCDFLQNNAGKYKYKYFCIPPIIENGEIISSTLIKNLLKTGNIQKANMLLESNFLLEGTVIHGAKLGREIGFPTANIKYPDGIVKIPFGVYRVIVDGKTGIMNWGIKPTVNNINEPIIEVHIFNFDNNLYGKSLRIEVLNKIRDERKFCNLNELKDQIQKDIRTCLESLL